MQIKVWSMKLTPQGDFFKKKILLYKKTNYIGLNAVQFWACWKMWEAPSRDAEKINSPDVNNFKQQCKSPPQTSELQVLKQAQSFFKALKNKTKNILPDSTFNFLLLMNSVKVSFVFPETHSSRIYCLSTPWRSYWWSESKDEAGSHKISLFQYLGAFSRQMLRTRYSDQQPGMNA